MAAPGSEVPLRLSRDEALRRIRAEGGDFTCLMCALRDGQAGPRFVIAEDDDAVVLLPRYVRSWGHILVILRPHVTGFAAVDEAQWARVNAAALRAARVVEQVQRPRRVYLASTGSSGGELTQSSAHLHIHALPVHQPTDRPADLFSWSDGLYTASDELFAELQARCVVAWAGAMGDMSKSPYPAKIDGSC
jgi:diadenosine tetraphosphate (Ap4A) HIT family hydrolase